MKPRTQKLLLLALAAALVLRELGWVSIDLAHSSSQENAEQTVGRSTGWPAAPIGEIEVELLEAGTGEARIEELPGGGLRVVLEVEPLEVGGLDWLPLFKSVRYSGKASVGIEEREFNGGGAYTAMKEGWVAGFERVVEGQRTVVGFHSRASLHRKLREEWEQQVREQVVESLREADADARAERTEESGS